MSTPQDISFPPESYLIGAAKSGTTSLAHLLDQHPHICLSDPKEPQFFWSEWDRGFDWYRKHFKGSPGQVLLDASQSYTMAPRKALEGDAASWPVPKRIHEARPDAKLIYMVRDPASRAVSNYWHAVRAGEEDRTLKDAIATQPYYMAASFYHAQISQFLNYFDPAQFLFLSFADFKQDPTEIARKCADFIGVDPTASDFVDSGPKNTSYVPKPWASSLLTAANTNRHVKAIAKAVKSMLPDSIVSQVKSSMADEIPETDPQILGQLHDLFAEDFARFQDLTGIRFVKP